MFSPQAWGWTVVAGYCPTHVVVFPTGVGVDRLARRLCPYKLSFSPQAWGWTAVRQRLVVRRFVFPTGVGVDRSWPQSSMRATVFPTGVGVDRRIRPVALAAIRFPHRRGGGPTACSQFEEYPSYISKMDRIFDLIATRWVATFSAVHILTEVMVKPLQEGNHGLAEEYSDILVNSDAYTLVPITLPIAE